MNSFTVVCGQDAITGASGMCRHIHRCLAKSELITRAASVDSLLPGMVHMKSQSDDYLLSMFVCINNPSVNHETSI